MSLSPQRIRETEFKSAKRGFDQEEVKAFQQEVADALEAAQNEATAMEARARAAVARLQELSAAGTTEAAPAAPAEAPAETPPPPAAPQPSIDDAETISRTLLLAQRTADQTVAEARAEADRLLAAARSDAAAQLDQARAEAARIIEEGRIEARRAGEADKARVEGEVQALLARRDFLESDVEHLDQFLVAQRERITEAAAQLSDMVQRIPGGLADMRRPLLSAADEPLPAPVPAPPAEETTEDATGDVWALRSDDAAVAAAEAEAAAAEDASGDEAAGTDTSADDDPGADATPAASGSLFDDVERPR